MRGRTLNDSFIFSTKRRTPRTEQMKMVLTRQGFNSKMVVTGDLTQMDLPIGTPQRTCSTRSEILKGVEGISSSSSTSATWCATAWCSASCGLTKNTTKLWRDGNSR